MSDIHGRDTTNAIRTPLVALSCSSGMSGMFIKNKNITNDAAAWRLRSRFCSRTTPPSLTSLTPLSPVCSSPMGMLNHEKRAYRSRPGTRLPKCASGAVVVRFDGAKVKRK
jgi:hypothetical protein